MKFETVHIEIQLREITRKLDALQLTSHEILDRLRAMAISLPDLITSLDANTNAVAAKLDKLAAELAAAGTAPTPEQLAQLQAVSDHLKALGADPANPVPTAPPLATDASVSPSVPADQGGPAA